jgi:lipoprotein-anchoring transpeptidase ErfK/SrfK
MGGLLRAWLSCSLGAALGLAALAALAGGCQRGGPAASGGDGGPSADGGAAVANTGSEPGTAEPGSPSPPGSAAAGADGKPQIGVVAFVATVYKEPRDTAKKLGYLRVGTKVPRSAEPAGKAGCPGGWYEIEPKGFVCAGDEATTDMDHPVLRAAARGPNLKTALPYRYAFVRAVLPLYLHVPTSEEQTKSEFKLQEHLDWYKENREEATRVILGADDVPIDARGVPLPDKKLGEMGLGKNSQEIGLGALLGGDGEDDAIPFWLAGHARAIPNISDYRTKGFEIFADRARRHTGLALIESFPTGADSLGRRFAVTTDLRLAPATKIKPDTGSPWHGLELDVELTLPIAFIRSQGARAYKIVHGKVVPSDTLEHRSVYGLNGKMRTVDGVKYYRTTDKRWLSQMDVGLAVPPSTWPEDAEKGRKWIEISITNQTLVLWEGKKPVYATLISTGQAGLDDPKKTTATVRGTFRIRNKHISAMMDSNESSAVGGHANTTAVATSSDAGGSEADDDDRKSPKKAPDKPKTKSAAKDGKGAKAKPDKGGKAKAGDAKAKGGAPEKEIPRRGDGVYGVTRRRGEGTFQLKDVPYIQYFESGYALHAAYWHDVFGTPRSHGCVNLAPVDAHRIFLWTDPPVPEGWHAVNAGDEMGEGTTVIIHE